MIRFHRPRGRAFLVPGAALAALCLTSPGAALADTNPYPNNPDYFSANELPDFGLPWEVSRDPVLPAGMAYLDSGDPSCPAPAPLTGTDASSPEGYTLPVQIKVTNGTMLAGYTAPAAHWKQPIPFSLTLRGLTGWVNARVQLPSMKLLVDPADVTFCSGAHVEIWGSQTAPPPEWSDWDLWDSPDNWSSDTQPDGTQYYPPPGTLRGALYADGPGRPPGSGVAVDGLRAKSVSASVTGIRADGTLDLSVDLDADFHLVRDDHGAGLDLPLSVSGTFSTAVKAPYAAETTNVPWDVGTPSPAVHRSYLPSRTLPGATEGATATVGSTQVDVDVSRLSSVTDPLSISAAESIYSVLYGYDPWGNGLVFDSPDATQFFTWWGAVTQGTAQFFAPDHGTSDVSVDMTIDRLGLPKGVPTGFGFDG